MHLKKNVIGSVYYLSPEQAAGQPVTPQSDLYSLGVVLFEMLTGKLPYDGDTPLEVARMHLESSTPFARRYDPDIPYYLDNIITKALAKNPRLRYATADDFLTDLKHAQTHLLGDLGGDEDAWSNPRKHPVSDETMVISKSDMLDGILKPQRRKRRKNGRKPDGKAPKGWGGFCGRSVGKIREKETPGLLHGGHRTAVRDHLCHPQLYQRGCDGAGSERQDHCGGGSHPDQG